MDDNCDRESDLHDERIMNRTRDGRRPRYQKELIYNKLLPYASDLDAESEALLAEIKGNLGRAVMLREIQPGCFTWVSKLFKYIRIYGMKFSKEDHILFINLMYEIITIPDLEPYSLCKFCATLVLLLGKKKLISPKELELPWRPLYELCRRIKVRSKPCMEMYRYCPCLETKLESIVYAVKIYFPISATQEILDELRPMLYPFRATTMYTCLKALQCLLPVQLPVEHHGVGYKLWLDEFMTFWEVCHNAIHWENEIMRLIAELAKHNIGYINWEPHTPLMFARFTRCLKLPVLYNRMQSIKQYPLETTPIAIWIVSTLGNGSSTQMYLEKFLKTVETYFHPANYGSWLEKLKGFLVKLPYQFILRLHKERYAKPTWETPIPDNYKLTDSDVDAFVKSMMPIVTSAMCSKVCLNDACQALRHLANMRPNLVIPKVLERMNATLDSVTEQHNLAAAMTCMEAVARPMVQGLRNVNKGYTYTEGPTQVLPLLFSCLVGIDPNNAITCFVSLGLVSVYATLIPIVDCSRTTAEMDEDERMVCGETWQFEDFVLQFLDRVFTFIDSCSVEFVRLEGRSGNKKSKWETDIEEALAAACMALLIQTSDKIFQSALHKLRTFVTERILETKVAGQLAAVLCCVFARVNGKDTLRALVPVLSQTILDATSEEDDIIKEENLDNQLLHAMLLLSAVVDTPGCNLLPHIETLTKVLDRGLVLKSKEGNTLACELLQTILQSLSTTVPYEFRHNGRDYNDPDYPYVRDWGQSVYIESLDIKWYIPGKEEMVVMQEIFSKYLSPEVSKLQRYCEDSNTLTRLELLTCLIIVNSIIEGSECVLPVWKEPALALTDSSLDWAPFSPSLGMKEEISMPDGGNVRFYMAGIMSNLQKIILKNAEDDPKSLLVLQQIWSSLLFGNVRLRDAYEPMLKVFHIMKKKVQDLLVGNKGHIRRLVIKRAHLQHIERVYSQTFNMTETHKRIILEVLTLATSRYADVRANAQSTLFSAFRHFPYAYTFVVPRLIEILRMDTTEHHDAYKGALYILFGYQEGPIVTRHDWKMLRSLWPTIVMSKTSEKPSVIRLKDILMVTVHSYFSTITIKLEIPDACLEAAAKLWESSPQPLLPKPNDQEIQRGFEKLQATGESNLETYNGLLDDLLRAVVEENLHWRHRLMTMNFLKDLVRPDYVYPVKIVRYFLGALIHDSLEERKIAIRTVVFMLNQQKRKHPKITIDSVPGREKIESQGNMAIVPGRRQDNSWLQYDYETRPLTAEQWDEPRFVHQAYVGYYVWPKKLEVYAPSSEQPCLDPEKRQLTEHEAEVHEFFDNPQNIEKLIKYLSLEGKKGKDKFSPPRYLLFKGLFRNHGIVHLKHFLPHLHRLVTDKQESSQRCAAEIIAGIIRGAKHWPFEMTCEMWEGLLPIIRLALANMTTETVNDWGRCFSTAQNNRDPNRHHWLLECVMEEPLLADSETSFLECGRLYMLQSILSQQLWRVSQLMERVIMRIEERLLTNPFEIVRDRLAWFLVTVLNSELRFPSTRHTQTQSSVQNLIDKVIPKLESLVEESRMIFQKDEQSLSAQVANVRFEDSTEDSKVNNGEREVAIRLLKTVCKWIMYTLAASQIGVLPGFYRIFPVICQLENCDTDEELTKTCSSALAMLAQAVTLPQDIPVVLEAVTKMSKSLSWWTRSTCLKFLQVSVFHNMSLLFSNPAWVNCVRDIVLNLLEDERLEVRTSAGNVLGGLLHCTFMPEQEKLLEEFKKKARTKIHKRDLSNKNKMETDGTSKIEAIRVRHAGVLGLCAFIQAHPYDIPEYVPTIFEHLGFHMNDPQPIPTTIRKTLDDFKRTHYDSWKGINGHAEHFTEEQLTVLQDLIVPPPHYT